MKRKIIGFETYFVFGDVCLLVPEEHRRRENVLDFVQNLFRDKDLEIVKVSIQRRNLTSKHQEFWIVWAQCDNNTVRFVSRLRLFAMRKPAATGIPALFTGYYLIIIFFEYDLCKKLMDYNDNINRPRFFALVLWVQLLKHGFRWNAQSRCCELLMKFQLEVWEREFERMVVSLPCGEGEMIFIFNLTICCCFEYCTGFWRNQLFCLEQQPIQWLVSGLCSLFCGAMRKKTSVILLSKVFVHKVVVCRKMFRMQLLNRFLSDTRTYLFIF